MRNIRKIGIRILLILAVVIVFEKVIDYVYRPHTETAIYTMMDREKVEGTIETLLCGPSTAQRGYVPEFINKEMDTVSFNVGTSQQNLDGTYHLIRSVADTNPVETVFLGISPDLLRKDKRPVLAKALVYDRLSGSKAKLSYLIDCCPMEEWPYLALYSTRVKDYFDTEFVKENLEYKSSEDYKAGKSKDGTYQGMGMYAVTTAYDKEDVTYLEKREAQFQADNLNQNNVAYLEKIIEYCNENNIELVLVYIPIHGTAINWAGDISTVHDYYTNLANEYDITFFDFTYYKNLKTEFGREKFESAKHLNKEGAEDFTELLMEVYKSYHDGEDLNQYFLDTCPYYIEESEN